jgi:hypothetical protein
MNAAAGAHVDQVIGVGDDVEVMLDNEDGVALVDQGVEDG